MRRKQIARDTVQILERGHYQAPNGDRIGVAAKQRYCIKHTQCYDPKELSSIREKVLSQPAKFAECELKVVNETTLSGAARLASSPDLQNSRIGVLNFASAKNPGGGFLKGAHAQEESLARSSGLYKSLLTCRSYYDHHRSRKSDLLYSDRMIYSPRCPVFRKDNGTLLPAPYFVDFITSPAPNAGAIRHNEPHNLPKIEATLKERSSKVLALAAHHGCDILVLGAWGCGVFRNDPVMVANTFLEHLGPNGAFSTRFRKILFAVLDTTRQQSNYNAFASRFVHHVPK